MPCARKKLLIPNTTQVPNVLIDHVMPQLKPSAVKVLFAIVRLTYGFQKQSDRISLTQLERATGLSREGVVTGIQELKPWLSVKPGRKGLGSNEYSVNLNTATGQLVRNSDQSENLTSQNFTPRVVRKSDSSKQIFSKQRRNRERAESDKQIPPRSLSPPSRKTRPALRDFELTEELRTWCGNNGVDPPAAEAEVSNFIDWHLAKGRYPKDLAAAFRIWIRKGKEFQSNGHKPLTKAQAQRERIATFLKHGL